MLLSELTLFAVCFKQLLFGGFSGYVTVARGGVGRRNRAKGRAGSETSGETVGK